MAVLIVANGVEEDADWLRAQVEAATAVLAADGGSALLWRIDRPPDLVIGDGDSLSADVRAWLTMHGTPLRSFPADKDETDLELALLYAAEQYAEPLHVAGAFGGRLDHQFANLLLPAHPALIGREVLLITPTTCAWIARERAVVRGAPGDTVSLLPVGGDVLVEATTGLRWPLHNERLRLGTARGVSNCLTAEEATIAIADGLLLCVHLHGALP